MRAAAAAALGPVLAGCGAGEQADPDLPASATAAPGAARQTCAQAVESELRDVALRVYDQAASGGNVASSEQRLARSSALATAVAHGDAAATREALRPLLRAQIQRIVVTRGSSVLADLGTGAALAPVHGVLRDAAGAPVGRYTFSVGDDAGIGGLIHALTGAEVVMRAGGRRVAATSTVSGKRYAVSTLRAAIVCFFQDPSLHAVRIRAVTSDGELVNDVGGPYVLAPASAPVRSHGRVIGRVTLSVQDDTGFIKLMRRFAGADVILRTPAGPVPGSHAGRTYQAFSFTAQAFPSGPLRISLFGPPASATNSQQQGTQP
jgi:hypothetical protein